MSQATNFGMMTAGPATAVQLAARLNPSLGALLSCHSGTTAPDYAVAGTVWLDTTSTTVDSVTGINVLKFYDGADWIPLIYVDPTNNRMWADQSFPEISIASAATVDALGAISPRVFITGDDGPITSLGTAANRMVWTRLENDTTFTHSAALKCPGDTDFAGKAGMRLLWASDSDGVPSIIMGMNADGSALVAGTIASQAEAEAGTDNTKLMTPLRTAQAIDEQVPTLLAARRYTGGPYTITLSGLIDVEHNFGAAAVLDELRAVCIASDGAFSVGDKLILPVGFDRSGTTAITGVDVYYDASDITTKLHLMVGTLFATAFWKKDFTATFVPDATKWKLEAVVRKQ